MNGRVIIAFLVVFMGPTVVVDYAEELRLLLDTEEVDGPSFMEPEPKGDVGFEIIFTLTCILQYSSYREYTVLGNALALLLKVLVDKALESSHME